MPKLSLPEDPELRWVAGIGIGAVVLLVLLARIFHDVQPA